MNMLFLETGESRQVILKKDRRYEHIVRILKKGPGEELLAGARDESTGIATIADIDDTAITLNYSAKAVPAPLYPITLLLGFPRPIQAGRIFKDICSLGVGRIILAGTELGEKSYIESNFFRNKEYEAALVEGAEQAGNPRLPQVESFWTLGRALAAVETEGHETPPRCWALDPYRARMRFGQIALEKPDGGNVILAIGSERGWSAAELDQLAESGFCFTSLGERILKSETACTVAVGIALAKLGYL